MTDKMKKILTLKTILTTLVVTIAGSSIIPVRANDLVDESISTESIVAQIDYSDRPNNVEPTDDFKNIVGVTGLAIGTGFIGWQVAKAYKPSIVESIPTVNNNNASLLDRVSPQLRRELVRLVHDRPTANRLLSGILTSHPDRSPNWLAEKAIYDLKRDR